MVVVSHLVLGAVGMTVHFKEQLTTVMVEEIAIVLHRQAIVAPTEFVPVVVVYPAVIVIMVVGVVVIVAQLNVIDIDAMGLDLALTMQEHRRIIVLHRIIVVEGVV